jgi:hypothetical protein
MKKKHTERLLIEISDSFPRKTLIRKLLLLIFPNELESISISKNCKASLNGLLFFIVLFDDGMSNYLNQDILNQCIQICIDLLSKIQRK